MKRKTFYTVLYDTNIDTVVLFTYMSCKQMINNVLNKIRESGGIDIPGLDEYHEFFQSLKEKRFMSLYVKAFIKVIPSLDISEIDSYKQQILELSQKLYDNRQIVENTGFKNFLNDLDPIEYIPSRNENKTLLEFIDDNLEEVTTLSKLETFFKKELGANSSFYEKQKKLLHEIYNLGGRTELKSFFRKYISFKKMSDEELKKQLIQIKNNLTSLNMKLSLSKNSKHIFSDENYDIVDVADFDDMRIFGSSAWCIWRNNFFSMSMLTLRTSNMLYMTKMGMCYLVRL